MCVCTKCAFLHDGFVNINDVLKVLFERLRLHERCENKKLPKTLNRQQSTSEAAVQYPKQVGINVSTLLLSTLTVSFHPFAPTLVAVAAAGSAPSAKDHPGVQAGQKQGLY